jgi:hypothetical protein
MTTSPSFDWIPLWAVFLLTSGIVLASVEGGLQLGRIRRRLAEREGDSPVGSVVGASLGLLAFLLAFTFGGAAERFDTRKQLLLDEVNAVRTAFLRADLLPEPRASAARRALREYVELRAGAMRRPETLPAALARCEEIHRILWSTAASLGEGRTPTEFDALFAGSVNEVIDLHSKRTVMAFQYRIPGPVWVILYVVSIASMVSVGYHFGLNGRGSLVTTVGLIFTFAMVIFLVADLDRPMEGFLRVDQQPMVDLQRALSN